MQGYLRCRSGGVSPRPLTPPIRHIGTNCLRGYLARTFIDPRLQSNAGGFARPPLVFELKKEGGMSIAGRPGTKDRRPRSLNTYSNHIAPTVECGSFMGKSDVPRER